MDAETEQRLWELYTVECQQVDVKPSVQDYLIWKEENDYAA